MPKSQATAQAAAATAEPDPLLGAFVATGATVAVFKGDLLQHVEYAPTPGQRRYRVDPATGRIVERVS